MSQWSLDKKILLLCLCLSFIVNSGCGKKNVTSEPEETQQIRTKTGREIFLEKTKLKEKSSPIKHEMIVVYPKEKIQIDENMGRDELNEEIKRTNQRLNQIIQNEELSEEEKNKKKEKLKTELWEYMMEGPCELTGEEIKTILNDTFEKRGNY